MEASSTCLAILTVCLEEPVPSGQEHWHCCQSAGAKTPKVTSRYWIVSVSAHACRQPAEALSETTVFEGIHARLSSGISARLKISCSRGRNGRRLQVPPPGMIRMSTLSLRKENLCATRSVHRFRLRY